MRTNVFIITLLIFLSYPYFAKSTGLSSDIIYINGEKWGLLGKPLKMGSGLGTRLTNFLPKDLVETTSNWDGYTGFWVTKDDLLYLEKIEVYQYDKENKKDSTIIFNADILKNVFAPYYTNQGIFAEWVNDEIRAGRGEEVRYIHSGFDRNYEEEYIFTVKKGKIVKKEKWHNYKKEGLKLLESQNELIKRFPFNDFSEIKGQRLMFTFNNLEILPDGHIVDCYVIVYSRTTKERIEDQEHPLIKAFKNTVKSIYPWEILYIYGKYRMEFASVTIPIWERNNNDFIEK